MTSNKIKDIITSNSILVADQVNKLNKKNKKVISLHIGEPDFQTPPEIITHTIQALKNNQTKYSSVPGILELRTEIANSLSEEHFSNISYKNIIISNGAKQSIYNIFQVICNPGDEIIFPAPYWVSFPESIKLAGAKPVIVPSKPNFQLDLEQIKNSITPKTKAILINSPNNPTGAVYKPEDLKELVGIAQKNELFIISDEAYEFLTYDNIVNTPIATIAPQYSDKIITIRTFSKKYCMTGFRIGFMVASEKITADSTKLQGHVTGNNCLFSQFGALAALQIDNNIINKMKSEFQNRRDIAYNLFSKIFECEKPDGAFYLFPKVDKYFNHKIKNSLDLASFILEEANVALLPGTAFGIENYLRISFANSTQNIEQAFINIKKALNTK